MGIARLTSRWIAVSLLWTPFSQAILATGMYPALANSANCPDKVASLFSTARRSVLPLRSPIGTLRQRVGTSDWGPRIEISLGTSSMRPADQFETLTIGQYNVLDLVEHGARGEPIPSSIVAARPSGAPTTPWAKPEKDLLGVAQTIARSQADILVVEEVGSPEILEAFSQRYLSGKYEALLIEGNGGGIHVGFLIKKDLPFDIEMQSFKNVADATGEAPLFSRDLPVLVFRERGGDPRGPPRLVVAGTHFKSQRTADPSINTAAIRTQQAEAAAMILQQYRQELGPRVPLVLAGDFNDDVRYAPAFQSLKEQLAFRDSFDLAPTNKTVALADRTTQTFHPRDGSPTHWSQLDAILISGATTESGLVREAQVVPYFDDQGRIRPVPRTHAERRQNPSDHFMVRSVLDYQRLRQLTNPPRPSSAVQSLPQASRSP